MGEQGNDPNTLKKCANCGGPARTASSARKIQQRFPWMAGFGWTTPICLHRGDS